jgi:hypothetical protein
MTSNVFDESFKKISISNDKGAVDQSKIENEKQNEDV